MTKLTPEQEDIMVELFKSIDASRALREMSSMEVADLVEEHLMGDISMLGSHYALLEDVCRRLRGEP